MSSAHLQELCILSTQSTLLILHYVLQDVINHLNYLGVVFCCTNVFQVELILNLSRIIFAITEKLGVVIFAALVLKALAPLPSGGPM